MTAPKLTEAQYRPGCGAVIREDVPWGPCRCGDGGERCSDCSRPAPRLTQAQRAHRRLEKLRAKHAAADLRISELMSRRADMEDEMADLIRVSQGERICGACNGRGCTSCPLDAGRKAVSK